MANKRVLKKTINCICSELFAECIAVSLYNESIQKESLDDLLATILRMHNHYIMRVSHIEPGMSAREYFKDLAHSFNKQVDEVIDHIGNLA